MRKKKITLKYPVEFEAQKVSELEIRSPKVKDYKEAQKIEDPIEREIFLFAKLTGKPMEFFDELEMVDYVSLQEALNSFLGR